MNRTYPEIIPSEVNAIVEPIIKSFAHHAKARYGFDGQEYQLEIFPPYTFVRIADPLWVGAGFSKCNPSDPFDLKTGIKIAFDRAIRNYVRDPHKVCVRRVAA